MSAYKELFAKHKFNEADWVSTWADAESKIESGIACMILHGHGMGEDGEGWKVLDSIELKTPKSFTVAGEVTNYVSSDHVELLEVEGCQVVFRFGMPDSIWYKKADEETLSGHVLPW